MEVQNHFKKVILLIFATQFLTACFEKSTKSVLSSGESFNPTCAGESIPNQYVVHWEDGSYTVEYAESEEQFKKEFIEPNLEKIKSATQDRVIKLESARTISNYRDFPNRDSTNLPTNIKNFSTDLSTSAIDLANWGQKMIGAEQAWAQNIKGQNVIVGVVDSFVDITHPQIQNQILINDQEIPGNDIDDDGNGVIDDYAGAVFLDSPDVGTPNVHGTHVSGIIAAQPGVVSNTISQGFSGVAPEAKIIPAQFISNSGTGTLSDAILALNYVASRGAKIINASWGGAPCVATLRNAIDELAQKGVLVIVAAGNSARDIGSYPEYPASFNLDNQITVAASTINDYMADFSNSSFSLVHVAAPGAQIYSTTPGGTYKVLDGTSMAAPFVSGAAALLLSANPMATVAQLKNAILKSVDVVPNHEYRVSTHGRINVLKAINLIKSF